VQTVRAYRNAEMQSAAKFGDRRGFVIGKVQLGLAAGQQAYSPNLEILFVDLLS
jgi:hypothetical protein